MTTNSSYHAPAKLTFTLIFLLSAGILHAEELTLAVANSTCNAIKKVGQLYEQQHAAHNRKVHINYICKSSGLLAKGLVGGAIEADIYISANRRWMNHMIDGSLVASEQVTSPWGNELVVATPKTSDIENFIWPDLASERINTILIGDPGSAPFGRYTKQALKSTDLWESVREKITTRKNITLLAESLAESDINTVGILFLSNAMDDLNIIYSIDKSWHSPIHYYLAPIRKTGEKQHVDSLVTFIQSEIAQDVFSSNGFKVEAQ